MTRATSVLPARARGVPEVTDVDRAIEQDAACLYDVAGEWGQIVDNVKHMKWFRDAVARRLKEDEDCRR